MPPAADLAPRAELCARVAQEAGALTLRYFQSPGLTQAAKDDGSPVTRADRETEDLLRGRIRAAFPGDAILGEEFGESPGPSGFSWVLDPIDGTKSFVRGIPTYGVLIAVRHEGRPVAGVAHFPALGETVSAAAGEGAVWQPRDGPPRPARVSTQADLAQASLECASPGSFIRFGRWPAYERLCRAVGRLRGWSDAYAWALVATGRMDAAIDHGLKLWDIAPFDVILREAGGRLTDWSGGEMPQGGDVLASNSAVHGAVLRILAG